MKKAMLLMTMFVPLVAFTQITGGLKDGLNIGNAKVTIGGESPGLKSKIGFHVGGYMNYAISDAISIQPEIFYNSIGAKYEEDDDSYSYEEVYSFGFISVPVLLVYNVNENVSLHAGPQLGFLTSAEVKWTESYAGDVESETIDIKEFAKSTDFGLAMGIGFSFGKFNASARYTIGLSNIADVPDAEIKTSAIQFSIGVKLFGE